ncbi:uncharacterized protein [Linepithema humile]|uniref:uncharacterized protein n=1 Tax=Linepithema humile TaxID=83485 RepID=UPI00351EBFE7
MSHLELSVEKLIQYFFIYFIQLALQEDGTEIDDDEILIQLSQLSTTPILLTVLSENKNWKDILAERKNDQNVLNVTTSKNLPASPSTSTSSMSSNSSKKQYVLNMKEGVWDKISDTIITTCQKGEKLLPAQRQAINRVVADYMINVLQQTSRGVSEEIAKNICETYPQTFKDTIDNQQWGSGVETLRMQIYNCVQYMKHTKSRTKRALSPDSDDTDQEERRKEAAILRRQDEYGCVEYAPRLPSTEDPKSQEEKRLRLIELFAVVERDTKEVGQLMTETYPTQRGVINEKLRNIEQILVDWPFLKEPEFILQHGSILLGKNIHNVWSDSLSKKVKPIRQYFKFSKNIPDRKMQAITCIINECKETAQVTKENMPKILVIFPLLLEYFGEKSNFLFKIISIDKADADIPAVADSDYPVLIIRGIYI